MAMAIPQSVMAYDFSAVSPSGHTLYYNIVDGHAEVVRPGTSEIYNNYVTGNLVIPSTVSNNGNDYIVTALTKVSTYGTFRGCSNLTSVTIPNSVTVIGDRAFQNCSGLTSIIIPNLVTSIGNYAFYGCSGLTGSLIIPNSVTSIGSYAFQNCNGLTSVTLPNSVSSIGSNAFSGVDTVYYCGITSGSPWGANVFENCITIIDGIHYSDSTLYAVVGCDDTVTVANLQSLTHIIADEAFKNKTSLISISIPNSVTTIGNSAFQNCSGLTSVSIPNSVTSIGDYAFYNCSSLPSVTIPNSVTSIGSWAFCGCDGLTSVTIPNSVTSIGSSAFRGCTFLASVTISNSLTSISDYAFYWCNHLTSVTIPNSVTSIGVAAFYDCTSLTSVTIGNSVTSIGRYAFGNCSILTSFNYTGTIAQWCGIDFGTPLQQYPGGQHFSCSYTLSINGSPVTNLVIPEGVTEIKKYAFFRCISLTSVTIPNSMTNIGYDAFYGCSGLTEITSLAPTAPTLGSNGYYGAFDGVSNTIPIHIPCGSMASYQTDWSYFSNISEPPGPYNINVDVADFAFGVSNIYGSTCDSSAVIEAVANYGYHFTQWNDGDTNNPRTITLTQDTSLIAYFDRNEYQLTLTSSDTTLGTVTGSGTYLYLDTAHIVANAIDHHHLVHWSDGNAEAARDIVITANLELTATFAIDTHTVSVVSNDIERGMVEATGTEFVYGTPCTVTATANTGYTFVGWSNGETATPYTFAVISDMELTALFEEIFTVTVESADTTMGNVTVNGDTSVTVINGETVTLTATANPDYHFTQWSDGDTESVRIVTVTANITYTAYFAIDSSFVSIVVNDETMGNVTGSGSYAIGDTAILTATANDGYHFEGWSITPGYQDIITKNPFTLVVTEDLSIVAYFVADSTVGISEVGGQRSEVRVYAVEGRIVVEGAEGETVRVFDMMGRMVAQSSGAYAPGTYAPALTGTPSNLEGEFRVPTSGVYMVKIGDMPARKEVVVR